MHDIFFLKFKKIINTIRNNEDINYKNSIKDFYKIKEIVSIYKEIKNLNFQVENFAFKNFNFLNLESENFDFDSFIKLKEGKLTSFINSINHFNLNYNINKIVVEIKAGTGGAEACIFSNDLFVMYSKLCVVLNFELNVIYFSSTIKNSYKEIIFNIKGNSVYEWFKYESGVHRVQRIPKTDPQKRIHTSTCSVFVYPEILEDNFIVKESEIRIDVFRSGGPGGQSVNTTDSAVRITHLPTKISVQCQDEKSQHKNKEKAFKILKSKLYNKHIEEKEESLGKKRKEAVKGNSRSDKIRTYNFPQNRCTDHRYNTDHNDLISLLNGEIKEFLFSLKKNLSF